MKAALFEKKTAFQYNKVMKISACIITYNEEDRIEGALESLKDVVDEIIVVDACSTDRTPQILQSHNVKFFQRKWEGYSSQKNFAISQASYPWILSIDADERLSAELRKEILQLKEIEPNVDAFRIKRKNFYLGKWIRHSGWYPDRKVRLFRKEKAHWEGDFVHERLVIKGRIKDLKGEILHYSYRNLSDNVLRIERYSNLSAEKMWREGKRSSYLKIFFLPFFTFLRRFIFQGGFLDGIHGLIISFFSSYYVFLKFAKLYELQRKR